MGDNFIKNNYYVVNNEYCDKFYIICYYISSSVCMIKARRIDHNEWGQDLKIVIEDIDFKNNGINQIISIGSCDVNVKIIEINTDINLIEHFEEDNIKIPKNIISYSNKRIHSDIYTYNSSMGIINLNPSYKYKIFNDTDIRNYIIKNHDSNNDFLEAFDLINDDSLKLLFFKCLYLYYNGGCYFPINSILKKSLCKIIDKEDTIILDEYNKDCIIITSNNITLYNYLIELTEYILNYNSGININKKPNELNFNKEFNLKKKSILENNELNKQSLFDVDSNESFFIKNNNDENDDITFYFYSNQFKDRFIIKKLDKDSNIYKIKRIDDICGWGQNLNIKAVNNKTNLINYVNIGPSDNNEKFFIL